MEVRVKVPDELIDVARARGLRPEALVEEILNEQVNGTKSHFQRTRTAEEIRGWLESLARFSDRIPPLPDTISREWIYQDHD